MPVDPLARAPARTPRARPARRAAALVPSPPRRRRRRRSAARRPTAPRSILRPRHHPPQQLARRACAAASTYLSTSTWRSTPLRLGPLQCGAHGPWTPAPPGSSSYATARPRCGASAAASICSSKWRTAGGAAASGKRPRVCRPGSTRSAPLRGPTASSASQTAMLPAGAPAAPSWCHGTRPSSSSPAPALSSRQRAAELSSAGRRPPSSALTRRPTRGASNVADPRLRRRLVELVRRHQPLGRGVHLPQLRAVIRASAAATAGISDGTTQKPSR